MEFYKDICSPLETEIVNFYKKISIIFYSKILNNCEEMIEVN